MMHRNELRRRAAAAVERRPNRTYEMVQRGEYWVAGCRNCHHPESLHVISQWEPRVTHCRCCADCPACAGGGFMRWSDQQTAASAREAAR